MIRTSSPRRQRLVRRAEDRKHERPGEPERRPDNALRDAVKLRKAGLRASERTQRFDAAPSRAVHSGFADCVKTTALGHAALKPVSCASPIKMLIYST